MTDDRMFGGVKKGLGRAKDAFGGLTGDMSMQARGKLDEVTGAVQERVGEARDQVQDLSGEIVSFTKTRPLTALAVTLGTGVLLGLMMRGRP